MAQFFAQIGRPGLQQRLSWVMAWVRALTALRRTTRSADLAVGPRLTSITVTSSARRYRADAAP
jgi:hypothetical protein